MSSEFPVEDPHFEDFHAENGDLRRLAAATDDLAARITGLTGPSSPSSLVPESPPGWAAATPAALAADALRRQLEFLGADIAETARRITAAATAYQEADARAATRFRLTR
ncbi:type VII secretion target [Actinoplanes missouriensis]|uniref:type VII secretion target n=1 Tax=Actinoplanes missouriensis TaxID=1866 RepID=UPI0033FCE1AF